MGLSLKKGLLYLFATAVMAGAPVRGLLSSSPSPEDKGNTIENTTGATAEKPLPDTLNFLWSPETDMEKAGLHSDGTVQLEYNLGLFKDALARQQHGLQDSAGTHAFSAFLKTFSHAENMSLSQLAKEVNIKVNDYMTWEKDQVVYNKDNYLASVMESLANKKGDCDDYSTFKYFTLRALGVPADRLYLSSVKTFDAEGENSHMILMMNVSETGKKFVMLDNRFTDPAPIGSIAEGDTKPYEFRTAVNEKAGWFSLEEKKGENLLGNISKVSFAISALFWGLRLLGNRKRSKERAAAEAADGGDTTVDTPEIPDFLSLGKKGYAYVARPVADTMDLLAQAVAGQKPPEAADRTHSNTLDLLTQAVQARKLRKIIHQR